MATDVDNNEDKGNDDSSTGCDKGDNCNCNNGKDACASATATTQPAMRQAAARREAEAVQRDATRQPAGTNKEEGSRIDACGGCVTKGDTRRRH